MLSIAMTIHTHHGVPEAIPDDCAMVIHDEDTYHDYNQAFSEAPEIVNPGEYQ